MKKPELVIPGGNFEKVEIGLSYGGDSVYIGYKEFSLRNKASNFNLEELKKVTEFVKSLNKKIYLAFNIFPHNKDILKMESFLKDLIQNNIKFDAFIVSDPGTILLIRETIPEAVIHLSTQANTTNYRSVKFWEKFGIKRIVAARELSIKELKFIKENTNCEIEIFVHGAVCVSYSGRCLLSNYMTGRNSNQGDCAHPCRWQYYLMEKTRKNAYFPVHEDNHGTYIYNSKDLALIENLHEFIEIGIDAFKIEGRMKGIHYLSTIVKTYRNVIDEIILKQKNIPLILNG